MIANPMFKAIIIGPPGSGKGTQSDMLATKCKFHHVSTGDLIREQIKNQTPIGLQIKDLTESGQLVPDSVVCTMLIEHLKSFPAEESFLIDGFPRTASQAQFLLQNVEITHVLELVGDEELITKRLTGRLYDPQTGATYHVQNNPPPPSVAGRCMQRKDDTLEVISQRFRNYNQSLEEIEHVLKQAVKIQISGKSIAEIAAEVQGALWK